MRNHDLMLPSLSLSSVVGRDPEDVSWQLLQRGYVKGGTFNIKLAPRAFEGPTMTEVRRLAKTPNPIGARQMLLFCMFFLV